VVGKPKEIGNSKWGWRTRIATHNLKNGRRVMKLKMWKK
jgi:ribosomal protein L34